TLSLSATGMVSGFGIFIQSSSLIPSGSTFGAGIRCSGGLLLRLFVKPITDGSAKIPSTGDVSISVRCLSLGFPINAGDTRYYQTFYRDPGFTSTGGSC